MNPAHLGQELFYLFAGTKDIMFFINRQLILINLLWKKFQGYKFMMVQE